jgi:hypothetical protein
MKLYGKFGNRGCVVSRKARTTGTSVSIYNNEQAMLDADGGAWSTVCEDHSWIVAHRSLKIAHRWLSHPEDWCEECMKNYSGQAKDR